MHVSHRMRFIVESDEFAGREDLQVLDVIDNVWLTVSQLVDWLPAYERELMRSNGILFHGRLS